MKIKTGIKAGRGTKNQGKDKPNCDEICDGPCTL